MHNTLIHFAHANGFPSGSYKKFLANLHNEYRVIAKDKFAHDPKYPLNDNWENQIHELLDYIVEHKAENEKVIAMGHSFGALLSYMAVCQRPDLFSGLIMLDPPLMTGLSRYVLKFAKKNSLIDRITPAGITQTRKNTWDNQHDLVQYFANKNLFKNFHPECIQDYVDAVVHEQAELKTLSFDVETEANIFRTIPHTLPSFNGQLKVPSVIVTGQFTDICTPIRRKPFLKRHPHIEHIEFAKGGHMFPLEYPEELALIINGLLEKNLTMNVE